MRGSLALIVFLLLLFSSCRGALNLNSGKTLYGSVTTPPCTLINGTSQYFAYGGTNIYEGNPHLIHFRLSDDQIIISLRGGRAIMTQNLLLIIRIGSK